MSRQQLALSLGVFVMVMSLDALEATATRTGTPAAPPPCFDLGWRASPGRLVTQLQSGLAALLGCPR